MLGSTEAIARLVWVETPEDPCLVHDPVIHARFRPNCKSRTKVAEGPWSDNSYNECGYRTLESCGPKPPGAIRVSVIGASLSYGYGAPYNDIYTTVAANALTRQCGRHVEFQNLGIEDGTLLDVYRRTDDALAIKPDVLLLVAGEGEIGRDISPSELAGRNGPPAVQESEEQSAAPARNLESMRHQLFIQLKQSRAAIVLQHFMYQNPETYAKLYLTYGDKADFMRVPFSPRWEKRLSNFEVILNDQSRKAQAASVPMVMMIAPTEAQIAVANSHRSLGVDPEAFSQRVSQIATRHGVLAIDLLPSLTGHGDIGSLIYTADGHLTPNGEHVAGDLLQQRLISSGIPAFAGCGAPR